MNKLKGLASYLVGNIDGVTHTKALGWRQDMTSFLKKKNVIVLDPLNKPIYNFLEDENFRQERKEALDREDYDKVTEMMRPTRNFDLRCIDKADFLICNIDMEGKPFGSVEEITTGNRQKKPIIIHCPQGKKKIPPWAFAMTSHKLFFDSWDQVKDYINKIDDGSETDDLSRWWFWDWDKLKEGTSL